MCKYCLQTLLVISCLEDCRPGPKPSYVRSVYEHHSNCITLREAIGTEAFTVGLELCNGMQAHQVSPSMSFCSVYQVLLSVSRIAKHQSMSWDLVKGPRDQRSIGKPVSTNHPESYLGVHDSCCLLFTYCFAIRLCRRGIQVSII